MERRCLCDDGCTCVYTGLSMMCVDGSVRASISAASAAGRSFGARGTFWCIRRAWPRSSGSMSIRRSSSARSGERVGAGGGARRKGCAVSVITSLVLCSSKVVPIRTDDLLLDISREGKLLVRLTSSRAFWVLIDRSDRSAVMTKSLLIELRRLSRVDTAPVSADARRSGGSQTRANKSFHGRALAVAIDCSAGDLSRQARHMSHSVTLCTATGTATVPCST